MSKTGNRTPVATALLIGLALIAAPTVAAARDLPATVKALFAGAKKEGQVKIYGRTLAPAQVRAFSRAISEFYGFPIKLNMAGGLHTAKAAELALALKKGAPSGIDVFWTSYNTGIRLEKAGAIAAYDWIKELGVDPSLRTGPSTISTHNISLCYISYNTNLIKPEDAPKSYDDLLNPKWKGRIAMPRSPAPWVFLATAMDEEKVAKLLTALRGKQKAKLLPRFGDVRARVMSGEFAIGIGTDVFSLQRKGAPVAMAPVDPMPMASWSVHIMKDVKSPNLAKLWGYFTTTAEGKAALDKIAGLNAVTTKGTSLWKLAQGKRVVVQSKEWVTKNNARLTKKFAKLMKIRR